VEVPATTRLWGDPARFRVKQVEVTFDYTWLEDDARCTLEALKHRVDEKAQTSADLEPLLQRLGAAVVQNRSAPKPDSAPKSGEQPVLGPAVSSRASARSINGIGQTDSDASTGSTMPSEPLGSISPRWRQLGFQSNNPRTDLRTGRLALEVLVYLAERYSNATLQMICEAQTGGLDYPFAVASINVTQHLARYLGLINDGSSNSIAGLHAPPRVVWKFARLLLRAGQEDSSVDPYCELHFAVLSRLHVTWKSWKRRRPELTVMDFSPAVEDTMAAVHKFLLSAPLEAVSELHALIPADDASELAEQDEAVLDPADAAGESEAVSGPMATVPGSMAAWRASKYQEAQAQNPAILSAVSHTVGIFGRYVSGLAEDTAVAAAAALSPAGEPPENAPRIFL